MNKLAPILFMHVTKTAGGTLKEIFSRSKLKVRMHYPSEEGFQRDFSYPLEYDIYYGHFSYGVHENLGVPPRYMGFVREPIARVNSHYNHLVKNDHGPVGENARKAGDLENYLYKVRRWEFDNMMCRMYSGVVNTVPFGGVGWGVLEKALENVENNFLFVGVQERFNESITRLEKIINVNLTIPRFNVNKGDYSKMKKVELGVVEELNFFDKIFYDKMLKSFDK